MSRLAPAISTEVYDTFWKFAAERQEIFFRRLENRPPPWSDDPIFQRHKFTNTYRASDRVSQFLIQHVIYEGDQSPEEVFFRTILFKLFNKVGTWKLLQGKLGEVRRAEYSFARFDAILAEAVSKGERIYSGAYIMPPALAFGYGKKHQNHLRLLEQILYDEVPQRVTEARTMRKAFEILRSYPGVGDFLAYQFVIDLNYGESLNFSEMEFVVPGPGARDGIAKCFRNLGGLTEADVIRFVTDHQVEEFQSRGLSFRGLWGRELQLVDCQNLFCEVAKYARLAYPGIKGRGNRKRIKQIFRPSDQPIVYWFPPKWGLNERIRLGDHT